MRPAPSAPISRRVGAARPFSARAPSVKVHALPLASAATRTSGVAGMRKPSTPSPRTTSMSRWRRPARATPLKLIWPDASNSTHTASPRRNAAARAGAGQVTITRVTLASSTNCTLAVPTTAGRAGAGFGAPPSADAPASASGANRSTMTRSPSTKLRWRTPGSSMSATRTFCPAPLRRRASRTKGGSDARSSAMSRSATREKLQFKPVALQERGHRCRPGEAEGQTRVSLHDSGADCRGRRRRHPRRRRRRRRRRSGRWRRRGWGWGWRRRRRWSGRRRGRESEIIGHRTDRAAQFRSSFALSHGGRVFLDGVCRGRRRLGGWSKRDRLAASWRRRDQRGRGER